VPSSENPFAQAAGKVFFYSRMKKMETGRWFVGKSGNEKREIALKEENMGT
jgi:hypothetical protein